jgi:hypothetical protein
MGLKVPPKKKKEEPKKPVRPLPPLLNQPPGPSKDDVLEGEITELRKDPYTPPPKVKTGVRPPPPAMDHRPSASSAAEERASHRKVNVSAVLLGVVVAGVGAAGAFYYLPKIGLDARLLSKLPPALRDNLPVVAYVLLGLGVIEMLKGLLAKPRTFTHCKHCNSDVAAFNRTASVQCEICGRRIGLRLFNGAFELLLWIVVLGVAAGAIMIKTGLGLA